jgi:hypothetical protein
MSLANIMPDPFVNTKPRTIVAILKIISASIVEAVLIKGMGGFICFDFEPWERLEKEKVD